MKLTAGTNIMITGLHTQNDLNGSTAVVLEPADSSDAAFVYVRLLTDNRKIKLKADKVLSLKRGPCFTVSSPTMLRAVLNPQEWGNVYDYMRIGDEAGKGEGMQAIRNVPVGMKLWQRPDYNEMYHFMPNAGGCMYKSKHYAFEMDQENKFVFPQEIQILVDGVYSALALTDGIVCVDSARFIGNVCSKGGCKNCGIGTFTMAALMRSSVDDMQDQISFFNTIGCLFVVNKEMLWSKMQLNEILTVVAFIMEQTKFVCDSELKADYTKYVWMRIAVWKTNAFESSMTLEAVTEIIDPLYEQKKKAHIANVKIWLEEIDQKTQTLKTGNMLRWQVNAFEERMLRIIELVNRTKLQVGDPCNIYQQLAQARTVILHPPHITKINGAKKADQPNCRLVTYIDTDSQNVSLPEDFQSYIIMEKKIKKGDFLSMQYNQGHEIEDYGYFKNDEAITLKMHAKQNVKIVEIIEICLSRFQKYLDRTMIEHLEYCVRYAKISDRVAEAKFSRRNEIGKILGFLKTFAE